MMTPFTLLTCYNSHSLIVLDGFGMVDDDELDFCGFLHFLIELDHEIEPLIVTVGIRIILQAEIEHIVFGFLNENRMQVSTLEIALELYIRSRSLLFIVFYSSLKWPNHVCLDCRSHVFYENCQIMLS